MYRFWKSAAFPRTLPAAPAALAAWLLAGAAFAQALPPPVINPHSTEICLNSRLSYHAGWSGAATDQMLANVLHAAAQAPVTNGSLLIYAATAQGVYRYDPSTHSLLLHKSGDYRSDHSAAFQVGVAAPNTMDAGGSTYLAELGSVALWTGTAGQLANCPRASDTDFANANWNPDQPIDLAVSFGIRTVAGLTSTLVAISSDGSLPNPTTDGTVYLDNALQGLAYDSTFAAGDLSLAQVSQLLWATYGCSNHTAAGKAGLVCPSAVANYYLTRRIYCVKGDGVYRYHVRRPPGTDASTRDHRIELVRAGDERDPLRTAMPRLPEAPFYEILCIGTTGSWPEVEVGFAAAGAVLEASTLDLQGYLTASLTAGEQAAIRNVTGIPSNDIPWAVVSLGQASGIAATPQGSENGSPLRLSLENQLAGGGEVMIRYSLPRDAETRLALYNCQGRAVRTLVAERQARGVHLATWDGRDAQGRPVASGMYYCRLQAAEWREGAQIAVVR